MDNLKKDIINSITNKNKDVDLNQLNYSNNTADIFNICINKIDYLGKIFDISKTDTKKFLALNEFYFYENIIKHFNNIIKIPTFFNFIKNDEGQTYGIILENLNIPNKIDYLDINLINIIIEHISKLHIYYWNKNNDIENILNYKNNAHYIIEEKIKTDIKYYFYNTKNIFDDNLYNTFDKLLKKNNLYNNANNNANNNINNSLNKTFIHGSLKIENIILIKNPLIESVFQEEIIPYFIDWSLFKLGYGVEDILFLLIFSLNKDLFLNNVDNIIDSYFQKINKYIVLIPKTNSNIDKIKKEFDKHIKVSLLDFILYAIVGLYIKNYFSKIKNNKLPIYLENYFYLIHKYFEK